MRKKSSTEIQVSSMRKNHHFQSRNLFIGYGGSSGGGINPLAALIAPLAGLALLGAAAAVSINPVLVQLAVINGGRKKRSEQDKKLSEIDALENFLFKHHNFGDQTEKLVANYLDCSGLTSTENQVCKKKCLQ